MNPSKIATWSGILGIPVLVVWYISQFKTLLDSLPANSSSWLPQTSLGLLLLLALVALIALAIGQGQSIRRRADKTAPLT